MKHDFILDLSIEVLWLQERNDIIFHNFRYFYAMLQILNVNIFLFYVWKVCTAHKATFIKVPIKAEPIVILCSNAMHSLTGGVSPKAEKVKWFRFGPNNSEWRLGRPLTKDSNKAFIRSNFKLCSFDHAILCVHKFTETWQETELVCHGGIWVDLRAGSLNEIGSMGSLIET